MPKRWQTKSFQALEIRVLQVSKRRFQNPSQNSTQVCARSRARFGKGKFPNQGNGSPGNLARQPASQHIKPLQLESQLLHAIVACKRSACKCNGVVCCIYLHTYPAQVRKFCACVFSAQVSGSECKGISDNTHIGKV